MRLVLAILGTEVLVLALERLPAPDTDPGDATTYPVGFAAPPPVLPIREPGTDNLP